MINISSFRPLFLPDWSALFISRILTCSALLNGAIWATSRARHKPYWFCPKPVNQRRYIFLSRETSLFFLSLTIHDFELKLKLDYVPFYVFGRKKKKRVDEYVFVQSSYIIVLNSCKRKANFFLILLSRTYDKYLSYCILYLNALFVFFWPDKDKWQIKVLKIVIYIYIGKYYLQIDAN